MGMPWKLDNMSICAVYHVRSHTVILPLQSNFAQFWYSVELGVKVQYILAVEALASLDEVEVSFLKLPDLHNMVFGALELCLGQYRGISPTPRVMTHQLVFLPEGGVDLEVCGPEPFFGLVSRGVFEIGEDESLAGGAVPVLY